MKKQLLLAASCVAFCASAALASQALSPASQHSFKAPAKAPEMITDAPAGETVSYIRSSKSYMNYYYFIVTTEDYGSAVDVVYGEDNKVYMNYPIANLNTQGWLEGTVDGDDLVFDFPQNVYEQDGEIYPAFVMDFCGSDDEPDYTMAESQQYRFTKDGDRLVPQYQGKEKIIGLCMELYGMVFWAGFGDYDYDMTVFTDTNVAPSSDLVTETYSFIHDGIGCIVDVAVDGSDIWLKGLSLAQRTGWAKGRIEGDYAIFPSAQYIGILSIFNTTPHYGYLMAADNMAESEEFAPELRFEFSPESKLLNGLNALVINKGPEVPFIYECIDNPVLRYQADAYGPAVPAAPVINDYMNAGGYAVLLFDQYLLNENGGILNADDLFYRVYINREVYTFFVDEFVYIPWEEITDVPWGFTEAYDILIDNATHEVAIYADGIDNIGVQSVYKAGGEENTSPVTYWNESGLNSVSTTAETLSTTYFDLAGRAIARPAEGGVYLRRTLLSNGTTTVDKIRK